MQSIQLPEGIRYLSLVFIPTNLCNFSCAHCYPASGPTKLDRARFGEREFDLDLLEHALRGARSSGVVLRRMHLAGGEVTLRPQFVTDAVRLGAEYGFDGSLTTNVSWAANEERANRLLEEWADAGLRILEISMGAYHREFQSREMIRNAIRAAVRLEMEVAVRPVMSSTYTNWEVLEEIGSELMDAGGFSICPGAALPIGRGVALPAEDLLRKKGVGLNGCWMQLNLTVRQDGWVYPCCAGADITEELRLGNLHKTTMDRIIRRAGKDMVLRSLVYHGSRFVAESLEEAGSSVQADASESRSVCELCNKIFSQPGAKRECARALIRTAIGG